MAIKKRNKLFYNCIWTLILAVLLALPTLGVMELSTLALEQETRCGQQEHNHTQECYFRDMLICDQKAHNHSENCYLVLLADNDINWLLSTIEDTEEKSLEDVIDSAMVQALNLNPNLNSGNSQQIQLAADNVRQLNDVIAEHHIEPAVVLNENIRDNYLAYVPPQPEPEEEEGEDPEEFLESSTFPVGPAVTDPTTIPQETTEETEAPETTVETEPTETTVTTEPPGTTEETEPPETTEETEPPETTEETEPPATTEETEPPETTEETEPPATTEETEPPATTEETEPPATTEETEPPATTEETEPPATTEETEPPATTEETEPPETTEETEPPATTEETEPPATTEETEPPETTVETEPSETGFLWETGHEIPVLSGESAGTGEAALYLYHGDYWVCIDVLSMDQESLEEETHYSISPEAVYEAFVEKIQLAEDRDPEELLYYALQSPAEGIEGIAKVGEERLKAEEAPGHFYLVDLQAEGEDSLLYEPVSFHRVVLESPTEKTEYYVQSGCSLSAICDQTELWQSEAGEPITGSELVTEDLTLYARQMPDDIPEEPETTGEPQETEPVITEETEPVSTEVTEETLPQLTDTLMQISAEGGNLLLAAPPSGNEGIALAAVGGAPSTANQTINFYILLDDKAVFVSSAGLTGGNFWSPKYCTYSTAASAYTSIPEIVTGLNANNINSSYFFHFNSSGMSEQGFSTTAATYNNNNKRISFSNASGPQYAILTKSKNNYSPVNFYTVKLDLSAVQGEDQIRYVESGRDSGLSLSDEYMWYSDEAGTKPATADQLKKINAKTTLYAKPKNKTVTFETNGGTTLEPKTVPYGTVLPQFENPTNGDLYLEGWYTDAGLNNRFDLSTPITEHMTLYAKWVETCVVSFEDAEGNAILEPVILGAGMELTLPEHYDWLSADQESYVGGQRVTITESTKFIGAIHTYTLNFHSNGTVYETMENVPYGSLIMLPKDPEIQGYRFLGWYMDEAYTQPFSREAPIVSDMDLYARWGFDVTLHYLDLQGEVKKQDILSQISGDVITLPEHYTWTDPGADPENPEDDTIYQGGETVTVLRAMTLIGQPDAYTIRYVDQDGNDVTEAETLEFGSSFFFPQPPEGCVWEGSDGSHYIAGDYYDEITSNLTFTAVETYLTVRYNVNFPSHAVNAVDEVPTLHGTTSATATDTIRGGQPAIVRSLTSNTARDEISTSNKESVTYFFKGWKVNGVEELIDPDTVLTWSLLSQYADAEGNVTMTGEWENGGRLNSVTFFVQFNSVAMDTDGNITSRPVENFTPEIFNTHLGGLPSDNVTELRKLEIADTSADNSYTADQEIRALYGERSDGIWMYEFPHDDDVFAFLKKYLQDNPRKSLSVDNEKVDPAKLDAKHYAIRWYVFKLEGSTWHVDGKLVRREGLLNIYKDFEGEESAINQAENGFYIVAENGTQNAAGEFVPYPANNSLRKQYTLTLADAKESNASEHSYYWEIKGVLLDELWRVTEFPKEVGGYSYYAEYSVYDSDGELTAVAEYGTRASVVGKTFALDEDPDQGMTVEFTNYYYDSNSILLKKEDAATGLGIEGAGFNFIQKDKILSFVENSSGYYSQDPDADNQDIKTDTNGYVTIDHFSYQFGVNQNANNRGSILIRESIVPEGYGWAATIDLELDNQNNVYIAEMTTVDGQRIDPGEWSKYAELPRNDVLIIKNHVTELISVTANKVWSTNVPADSVQVVLQANGQNAANIFPGLKNAQVKLSAANNWTYTWEKLPRYAGGQVVRWGIKEVVVGNAPTLSDGVTFANWIPSYSSGTGTDTDGDGDVDNWSYTVTNYSKSPKLIVSKVGVADEGLPGAVFTLEQVELKQNGWQRVSGTSPISQTTDDSGMLTFENLVGTYTYRLTEVKAPAQHIILIDPLVFTVDGDGRIQKLDDTGQPVPITGEFLKHPSAYNLVIKNLITVEMPETGGSGTPVYWLCGMALMLTALLLYKLPMRKEDLNSS